MAGVSLNNLEHVRHGIHSVDVVEHEVVALFPKKARSGIPVVLVVFSLAHERFADGHLGSDAGIPLHRQIRWLLRQKVWKNNVSPATESLTWREIYINRCRVLFDGCYICKINYQRLGENSFQDQFYRPVQIVEYFRLIRFFADGTLFMTTSADELQNSVNRLKNPKIAMQSREILKGNYHYQDNHVLIVIKKNSSSVTQKYKRKNIENDNCLTFFMELEIGDSPRRNFAKLSWKNYSVSQLSNNQEISSDYDLRSSAKYPPFFFSHVKSFFTECNECLQ